jgi:hypothetical protein
MTGGVVSRATVTVKVQVTDSRQEFVARQVTRVVPRMNKAPEGGVQVTMAFVGQLPVVVGGGYVTKAVLATPQCQLVLLGGQVMRRGLDCWAGASAATRARKARRRSKTRFDCGVRKWRQADRPLFGVAPKRTRRENELFITSLWSWISVWSRLCGTRPVKVIKKFPARVTKFPHAYARTLELDLRAS